jgi:tripartite-type tricarboxylate transporter receptor subunit TctC
MKPAMPNIVRKPRRPHALAAIFAAAMLCHALPAAAQAEAWPTHAIKLVAPSAPGGATDSVGRILGRFFEKELKQPIVVEAKAGAGAIIGTEYVKNAPADGYTVLISGSSTHSANPFLYAKLPYDPQKDFRDIGMVGFIPAIGMVRAGLPIHSTAELVSYAKAHPGKLSYGYATSSSQVPPAIIKSRADIDVIGAAYKSLAQIITDLAGGTIDFAFLDIMSAAPALQNKAIVPIATTSLQRAPSLPEVPTVAEALPGFEVRSWIGLAVPAGTPDAVVDRMNKLLNAALADPPTRQGLERLGMTVQPYSLVEMAKFTEADRGRWREWVRLAKIDPIQ